MLDVPEILDIRDDLDRAEEAVEQDIDEDIGNVRNLLDSYEDRGHDDYHSLLDELHEELLRLEELVESDQARLHLQAARNRVRIYRDAIADSPTALGILTTKLTTADTGDDATLRATVVNEGSPTTVDVIITFYDDDVTELETIRSEPLECDVNAESTIVLDVALPDNYAYYVPALEERD